jgi:nitrogen fixation protein NifU and related proteins
MDSMYQDNILDHYKHPRNHGRLEQPSISHEEHNPLCGDKVRFDLLVEDGIIKDVRFVGKGCAISQAAASMLTEEIKGKSVEEVKQVTKDDILELLGIPIGPVRLKCALLPLKTVKVGIYGLSGELPDDE